MVKQCWSYLNSMRILMQLPFPVSLTIGVMIYCNNYEEDEGLESKGTIREAI